MARTGDRKTDPKAASGRRDRLKSALKANIARRKAQARARSRNREDATQEKG